MAELPPIADAPVRRLAETTFDRNVVVIAGAGTGKTTLLVNRLIHALMRDPDPSKITQVVALTFTNKAATEMKVRLRERLLALLDPDRPDPGLAEPGAVRVAELRERYGLSTDKIEARANAALHDLEKAQIGTLHSFAAHLLRLHPIESGVDPDFEEDDGLRFDEHFAAQWDWWLDQELGVTGQDHGRWRRLLAHLDLGQLREVARQLCSELVSLEELTRQMDDGRLPPSLQDWFAGKQGRTAALLSAYDRPKRRKIEAQLAGAQALFALLMDQGVRGIEHLSPEMRDALAQEPGDRPAGWREADGEEARGLIRIAKRVLAVDQELMRDLMVLLAPYVRRVRASFLEQGWITFDGLLARARALLRDHPGIRERLKHDYQAILVDEFQDTDPTQYEIMLYLAERPGRCRASWRELDLAPGKLFIVGDPKQSIYAFRRADIEAFDQVVNKVRASGGVVYDLVTNFRSHAKVLEVVNALFDRLLRPQENLQPPHVPLLVRPGRQEGVTKPGAELRLVKAAREAEDLDAAAATRLEAEALATWLKEEVLGKEVLTDGRGRSAPVQPGHVALLFRKLTQAQEYLEALRRHEIPYLTDGEKHFYRRQEVVDLVNLMRVVDNPHDHIAMVGLLRSPIGGVTDQELVELQTREGLDYRRPSRLRGWTSPRASAIRLVYARLAELNQEAPRRALPDALSLLFAKLPVLELAAASFHGEQAVANLIKIRDMAGDLADRPSLSFAGFVELMIARLSEQPEEAESALTEESLEAVRVLTIHKAKGLEFPVVVLPGLHHGAQVGRGELVLSHDWSTGVMGLTVGDRCSLGAVLVNEKYRAREEAERYRLFYVGTTRAKERLILSGGLPARPSQETFLAMLEAVTDRGLGEPRDRKIPIGEVILAQTVTAGRDRIPRRRRHSSTRLLPARDSMQWIQQWQERDRIWEAFRATPQFITPSRLRDQEREGPPREARGGPEPEKARLIGTLAHRILELWDFRRDPRELDGYVQTQGRRILPAEWVPDAEAVLGELRDMFTAFVESPPYAELRRATILGREVPFTMAWPPAGQAIIEKGGLTKGRSGWKGGQMRLSSGNRFSTIMEGTIDLFYRVDGRIWVADYKTDRVPDEALAGRAVDYRLQGRAYCEAVARCLAVDQVGWKVIFLRQGRAVEG